MNRRGFLSRGLLGTVATVVATSVNAKPTEVVKVDPCKDGHDLIDAYADNPALQIGTKGEEGLRSLVPCRRCGALFAPVHKATGQAGIVSTGAPRQQHTRVGSMVIPSGITTL